MTAGYGEVDDIGESAGHVLEGDTGAGPGRRPVGSGVMPLDQRFQKGVDALSMLEGSNGSDEYLAAWEWGKYTEVEGGAREVAALTVERFNKGFPKILQRESALCTSRAGGIPGRGQLTAGPKDGPDGRRTPLHHSPSRWR